jgi:hypothetical protein
MPTATVDLSFRFLDRNNGRLSGRARSKEFAALTESAAEEIEAIWAEELVSHQTGSAAW